MMAREQRKINASYKNWLSVQTDPKGKLSKSAFLLLNKIQSKSYLCLFHVTLAGWAEWGEQVPACIDQWSWQSALISHGKVPGRHEGWGTGSEQVIDDGNNWALWAAHTKAVKLSRWAHQYRYAEQERQHEEVWSAAPYLAELLKSIEGRWTVSIC